MRAAPAGTPPAAPGTTGGGEFMPISHLRQATLQPSVNLTDLRIVWVCNDHYDKVRQDKGRQEKGTQLTQHGNKTYKIHPRGGCKSNASPGTGAGRETRIFTVGVLRGRLGENS